VAAAALDGLLDLIVRTVHSGDSVSIAGFGVFERRERAARSARNPRTGQRIEVPATAVPAFRPGTTFRDVVSGVRRVGATAAPRPARVAAPRPTAATGALDGSVASMHSATAAALVADPVPTGAEEPKPGKAKVPKGKAGAKAVEKAKVAPEQKTAKNAKADKADKGRKKTKK
jgi:DNA-binding protein HU-beta